MKESNGFLVVLPEQIIEIPQNSNLSWLRMFYALPKELVAKRSAYLDMPRNIRRVLDNEQYRAMLKSDSFLELVWDCYAWAVWQSFQIPHKDGTYHDIDNIIPTNGRKSENKVDIFPQTDKTAKCVLTIHAISSFHVKTVYLLVRTNGLHIDIDVDVEDMLQEKRGQVT